MDSCFASEGLVARSGAGLRSRASGYAAVVISARASSSGRRCASALAFVLALAGCGRSTGGSAPSAEGSAGAVPSAAPPPAGFAAAPREGYVALALTDMGACGVTADARVACWGAQILGRGTEWLSSASPAYVSALAEVVDLRASAMAVCARTRAGAAWCWGLGPWGATKDGYAFEPQRAPHLDGLTLAMAPSDGHHGCGIDADGGLRCWGSNARGQVGRPVGIGDFTAFTPVTPVMAAARTVAVGPTHSCAATKDGRIACWGDAEEGALGDGDAHQRPCEWVTPPGPTNGPPPQPVRRCQGPDPVVVAPVNVPGLDGATAITAGRREACAIAHGRVRCWGSKLGLSPRDLSLEHADQIGGNEGLYCARTEDSAVWCWGWEDRLVSMAPKRIEALSGATRLAVNDSRACAIVDRGAIRCWGRNASFLPIEDWTDAGPPR